MLCAQLFETYRLEGRWNGRLESWLPKAPGSEAIEPEEVISGREMKSVEYFI